MDRTAETLLAELEVLNRTLRSGQLGELAGLARRLTAAAEALAVTDAATLDRIRCRAAANAACLAAAARGVRAARRRLADIRGMTSGLGTYDPQGRRAAAPGTPATLTQRL